MDIKKIASAGTLESCDIVIMIEPNPNGGIEINLNSSVDKQFGNQIKKVILNTLLELDVKDVIVAANDRGALDFAIRARVQSAAFRGAGIRDYCWEVIDK